MPIPKAEKHLLQLSKEVLLLLEIADDIDNNNLSKPKLKAHAMYRVSLVYLVGIWETYIENIIEEAFNYMLSKASDPDIFSNNVLLPISNNLKKDKDPKAVWGPSGDKWKIILRKNMENLRNSFHSPSSSNIDKFARHTIGYIGLSKTWAWRGISNDSVNRKLKRMIIQRGEIVHTVHASRNIQFDHVNNYIQFICRLSTITANRIRNHVHSKTGAYPWDKTYYGSTD